VAAIGEFQGTQPASRFSSLRPGAGGLLYGLSLGRPTDFPNLLLGAFGQVKADIWRYCIVWEQGGDYLDINKAINTDLRLVRTPEATGLLSIERNSSIILRDDPTLGGLAYPEKVAQRWWFGFEPRHPMLYYTINRVVSLSVFFEERVFDKALGAVVAFNGPGAFTWAVRKFFSTSTGRGVAQLTPDFNGLGVTRLPGADSAFSGIKNYSKWTNCHILDQL